MDIFLINIDSAEKVPKVLLDEYQKKEMSDENKWRSHCLAYLMLDRILDEVYHIEDREIVFENNKPLLKNNDMHFSISHSGEYVALAFSEYNCGVDIEQMKLREFERIAERMEFECDTLQDFYYEWTKFEAEFKLGDMSQSYAIYDIDGYTLSVVSENPDEEFELFIQNDSDIIDDISESDFFNEEE